MNPLFLAYKNFAITFTDAVCHLAAEVREAVAAVVGRHEAVRRAAVAGELHEAAERFAAAEHYAAAVADCMVSAIDMPVVHTASYAAAVMG